MRHLPALLLLLVLAQGIAAPAHSCGLLCSCTVSATPHAFGSYDPLFGAAVDSSSGIEVTCSTALSLSNVAYEVTLDPGLHGSFAERRMSGPDHQLGYNLYTDALRTSVWGDGDGGTATISDSYVLLLGSRKITYTAYGRIPGAQIVGPGSYLDSVTATVTF